MSNEADLSETELDAISVLAAASDWAAPARLVAEVRRRRVCEMKIRVILAKPLGDEKGGVSRMKKLDAIKAALFPASPLAQLEAERSK